MRPYEETLRIDMDVEGREAIVQDWLNGSVRIQSRHFGVRDLTLHDDGLVDGAHQYRVTGLCPVQYERSKP